MLDFSGSSSALTQTLTELHPRPLWEVTGGTEPQRIYQTSAWWHHCACWSDCVMHLSTPLKGCLPGTPTLPWPRCPTPASSPAGSCLLHSSPCACQQLRVGESGSGVKQSRQSAWVGPQGELRPSPCWCLRGRGVESCLPAVSSQTDDAWKDKDVAETLLAPAVPWDPLLLGRCCVPLPSSLPPRLFLLLSPGGLPAVRPHQLLCGLKLMAWTPALLFLISDLGLLGPPSGSQGPHFLGLRGVPTSGLLSWH